MEVIFAENELTDKTHEWSVETQTIRTQSEETNTSVKRRILSAELISRAVEGTEIQSIITTSDIQPKVYEGGFKIWETTIDLIGFLIEQRVVLNNKRVLELGCGGGLPGIFCAMNGASHVVLQDYNEPVLRHFTAPNAVLNGVHQNCKYIAADWANVPELLSGQKFDVILTCDTLYSVASMSSLLNCIADLLHPCGHAFVASKSYYFGVGGGLRRFEGLVKEKNTMCIQSVRKFQDGVSNIREIAQITFKESQTNAVDEQML
eukprot:TRINITY_DN2469_c0_g1_i2.p1 TRINITY_DN2469_c0_g1~~TRINITY_DN2469_c0_g1_i2.p1  ORF type:complete len:262 (+),score=51.91 TRINITY_DN2469_c0_g1_i2:74-859(+)